MTKFLKRLFFGSDDSLLKILRDELKMLREQLAAKDRQIEQLQAQVGSVLSYQYDRPKIVSEAPAIVTPLPADVLSDVITVDDEAFIQALEDLTYKA
jgi:hypothetical protein